MLRNTPDARVAAPASVEPCAGAAVVGIGGDRSDGRERRLRVAFVIDSLRAGGAETIVSRIVRGLAAEIDFQIVALGASGPLAAPCAASGAAVETLGVARWNPFVLAETLARVRAFRPDVVVGALFKSSVVVPRVAERLGVPYVIADYSSTYDPEIRDCFFPTRGVSALYFARFRSALAHAAVVAVQSARDETEYGRILPAIAPRIARIPNGIDADAYSLPPEERAAARAAMRRSWGVRDDAFVVGSVMRLHGDKRPDVLGAIAADLRGRAETVAVGGGARARSSALRAVRAVGPVAPDRVPQALAAFDVFLLPSRADPFPLAVLEAGAAGLPTVASSAGGASEVVVHGETGWLLPPEGPVAAWSQAIRRYGDEPSCRALHAGAASIRVRERFAMPRFLDAWRSVLGRAASARTASAGAP